jgi:hypothetical protein
MSSNTIDALPTDVLWSDLERESRNKMTQYALQLYLIEKAKSSKKILSGKAVNNIIKRIGSPPWMTRFTIYNAARKYKKEKNQLPTSVPITEITINCQNVIDDLTEPSDESCLITVRNKGGRPNDTQSTSQKTEKRKILQATEIAAITIAQKQKKAKLEGLNKLPHGEIEATIRQAIKHADLSEDSFSKISKNTVLSRVKRGNFKGQEGQYSTNSPMKPIEGLLVNLCIQLNRLNKSIDQQTFLDLANDMVKDSEIEGAVVEIKQKICGVNYAKNIPKRANLGPKYFKRFMERHKDKINYTKVTKNASNALSGEVMTT